MPPGGSHTHSTRGKQKQGCNVRGDWRRETSRKEGQGGVDGYRVANAASCLPVPGQPREFGVLPPATLSCRQFGRGRWSHSPAEGDDRGMQKAWKGSEEGGVSVSLSASGIVVAAPKNKALPPSCLPSPAPLKWRVDRRGSPSPLNLKLPSKP